MQWSVLNSLEHEFIKRKLVPKYKIQYIKLHQADQRETESRFNIAFGHHCSNPSTIIYPEACRAQKWQAKLYSPDEFFRATLNIGAFQMRNDYIWLVLKEFHHQTGYIYRQERAGRDFQPGLELFSHQNVLEQRFELDISEYKGKYRALSLLLGNPYGRWSKWKKRNTGKVKQPKNDYKWKWLEGSINKS